MALIREHVLVLMQCSEFYSILNWIFCNPWSTWEHKNSAHTVCIVLYNISLNRSRDFKINKIMWLWFATVCIRVELLMNFWIVERYSLNCNSFKLMLTYSVDYLNIHKFLCILRIFHILLLLWSVWKGQTSSFLWYVRYLRNYNKILINF